MILLFLPFWVRIQDMNLVTTSLSHYLENIRAKPPRTLYFCHATRNDVILGFLGEFQRRKISNEDFEAGLVICKRQDKYNVTKVRRTFACADDQSKVMMDFLSLISLPILSLLLFLFLKPFLSSYRKYWI